MGPMVEGCVGPSELHLRKELTALRKARFLRDPETSSTWRSPLDSRPLAAASNIVHNSNGVGDSIAPKHTESPTPSKGEKKQKKVYLYNWRQYSNKSSESGMKLDEDINLESPHNSNGVGLKSNACQDDPVNIYNFQSSTSCTPIKRVARRSRVLLSKKGTARDPAVSKLLDLHVNSTEQTEDTENSQVGYFSRPTSPLFAACGCVSASNTSRLLKVGRREGSSFSCTPISTRSYYKHGRANSSTIGSWDGRTATSFDGDESNQSTLWRSRRSHVPGYSSKRNKCKGSKRSYSPSLSDILRRKGSGLLCGSQTLHRKKRSFGSLKWGHSKTSAHGMSLLDGSCDFGSSSFDSSSDELSTNVGELDLEALSRLDGRRWSSCKSQDGVDPAVHGADLAMADRRSLSQKYRPKLFSEIVGQHIVAQSLSNAITREKIAPAYLFQGPRGTGKTSTARIFSMGLSCLAPGENKPCGICKECTDFLSGNGTNLIEVDASNRKSINRIKNLLENIPPSATSSRYKLFVVDECHMVSSKLWSAFMKFLDEPLPRVVFVFITIDPDNLPRAVISRCQKYVFSKIKDIDIVCRLRRICVKENLDVELAALDLIALNSDGSLRDAETMLDQLSLLGKKITPSLVNDLVGVVSEEKLLDLLEIAMSSDTAETVKRSRELMDSGIDPMALMSQLAGLIMDIIAGTYKLADSTANDMAVGGRSLTGGELERLQQALKILSDAEKQIRLSSERSTWFTAALLQLSCGHSSEMNQARSSTTECHKSMNDAVTEAGRESSSSRAASHSISAFGVSKKLLDPKATSLHSSPQALASHSSRSRLNGNFAYGGECMSADRFLQDSTQRSNYSEQKVLVNGNLESLAHIWMRCIENCHSKTLQQLLFDHGKLVCVRQCEGCVLAFIAFEDRSIRSRAERFLSSITNSIETVLRCTVEVRMGLLPDFIASGLTSEMGPKVRRAESDVLSCSSNSDRLKGTLNTSSRNFDYSDEVKKGLEQFKFASAGDERLQSASVTSVNSGKTKATHMSKISMIDEQRLESAWLQAAEKHTPGMVNQTRPDRHQVVPQIVSPYERRSSMALVVPSGQEDEDLSHGIKAMKIVDSYGVQKDQNGRNVNRNVVSPSKLHSDDYYMENCDKESIVLNHSYRLKFIVARKLDDLVALAFSTVGKLKDQRG
ncbi:hypothetical protein OsI_37801 [Oryza sativa Indica Group]|uniref:Uncharacterized protein n=2 Tax=Oryza TaxID=4527 RepID=A0A0E0J7Y6_ORYNI|nr:hypothetical protein OsI_37801 [Oryza sativa Indica Group]